MNRLHRALSIGGMSLLFVSPGCVSVKAPERIDIDRGRARRRPIDTRSIPSTSSHEDARRKLGEAHAEINDLRAKNRNLEKDKRELKQDVKECERQLDRCEDRYDD